MYSYAPLFLPRRKLLSFAQKQNTPFYLYDEQTIAKRSDALTTCFSFAPHRTYFPVHLNPNPKLLSVLQTRGFGVWCENEFELRLCKDLGFSGSMILYAPYIPMPSAEDLAFSLDATFVITAPHCLPSKPVKRVIFSYQMHSRIQRQNRLYSGLERNKQGFSEAEMIACVNHFARYGTKSFGILLRTVSTERQSGYLAAAAEELFALAKTLKEKTGIIVSSINLGDGLYVNLSHPQKSAVAETEIPPIRAAYEQLLLDPDFAQTKLETTIGKWLIADAGIFVTRIAAIFSAARPLLITQAAYSQLPDFSLLGKSHEISVLTSSEHAEYCYYDICSAQFHHRKNFAEKKLLETCKVGDYLIIHSVGANTRVLSQPLTGYPPCPEFLLKTDKSIEPI